VSRHVVCDKCKQGYLAADGIDESALVEPHKCPGTVEERLAALEKRMERATERLAALEKGMGKLERATDMLRWRA